MLKKLLLLALSAGIGMGCCNDAFAQKKKGKKDTAEVVEETPATEAEEQPTEEKETKKEVQAPKEEKKEEKKPEAKAEKKPQGQSTANPFKKNEKKKSQKFYCKSKDNGL